MNLDECPKCNSSNITAEDFDIPDGNSTRRKVRCCDCGEEWHEEWQCVKVVVKPEPKAAKPK